MSGKSGSDKKSISWILEHGSLKEMRAVKKRNEDISKYQWEHYYELARQRQNIQDELQQALIQTCLPNYTFKYWQRAVKYKYGLHPFSTAGSIINIGGRFNTGKDVNSEAQVFPALYLASNKDTALQEHLGQQLGKKKAN